PNVDPEKARSFRVGKVDDEGIEGHHAARARRELLRGVLAFATFLALRAFAALFIGLASGRTPEVPERTASAARQQDDGDHGDDDDLHAALLLFRWGSSGRFFRWGSSGRWSRRSVSHKV